MNAHSTALSICCVKHQHLIGPWPLKSTVDPYLLFFAFRTYITCQNSLDALGFINVKF